ncbi:ClbS/DfsB family four-helix bundle protein [Paenibacillus monticola]|uniref:ClbS/DfsB family four-helix bundle protein n=1 Tax=Paenibacillus monticola TaxID=2666075 RepID=A0A7X2L189_9BACL|nr:ClbS/DfsB family four-helix bundle protein [Paenibacillus monticola]MRN53139.1 ClbS/DfsB family four-helix bundle protein [Paenibacillus monticola]
MSSNRYSSKEELKEAVHTGYLLLNDEYKGIDNSQKDIRLPETDKTPAEIIAYQLGWLNLVMGWDRDEKAGKTVIMPAPNYKWNRLGDLNQLFYVTYSSYSLNELLHLFKETEQQWLDWIDSLNDKELFTQGIHKWTGDNPNWPLAKWIHINSVAPFKSFRAKLRKWKKEQQANI